MLRTARGRKYGLAELVRLEIAGPHVSIRSYGIVSLIAHGSRRQVWHWGINMPGLAEDGKGFRCLSYSVHEGVIQNSGGHRFLSFCNTKVFD